MKRLGVGLPLAAVLGLVACAHEELDPLPFPSGSAGRAASGGSHAGNTGRGGSSASSTQGGAGQVSQAGVTGSVAGASSSGAGAPSVGGAGGLLGASGSISQGGSAGNISAPPVFESGTCASSPSMSLSYQQASSNSKQITGRYQFSNTTDTPIPLAQLKIRYLFSNEETSGWSTAIYDAKLEGGTGGYRAIMGSTLAVSPLGATVPGADSYLELAFNSTLSIEKGATATVSWDLQPKSYNPPDQVQTDDYSYNAAAVAYTVWDHVLIYQGSTLVWGCTPKEPGSGSAGTGGGGGSGAVSGSAGAGTGGGSGTSGAGNGGAGGAGMSGTAGANAGAGGDTTSGGTTSGGTTSGGTIGVGGGAGSNLGGTSGSSGAGGDQVSAGTSGSGAGNGGSSGAI